MKDMVQKPTAELVDFASGAAVSKNINLIQRVTFGAVTIGRYVHNLNAGVVVGTAQCTVLVHEGNVVELDWRRLGEEHFARQRMEFGDIQIHPCDTLVYKRWHTPSQMLFLAVDRAFVDQVVTDVFGQRSKELKLSIGIRDPIIKNMAELWREELRTCGTGGRVCAEALATTLIVHLFRVYGERESYARIATGGMSNTRLRRVLCHIDEHLAEDIGLSTLASIAGFSIHHFCNVFKMETGFTPHHFLIGRRINRAKELLLAGNSPISQISAEVGFSGQSHFTEQFRKAMGTTPLRFRQSQISRRLSSADN